MSCVASLGVFNLTSSFTCVSGPRSFSRVSFTAVSMHSQGRGWKLEATAGDEKSAFEEKITEAQKAAGDFNEAVKDKAIEINKGAKDAAEEINEGNRVNLQSIKDKNDQVVGAVSEKTKEASKFATDKAEEVKGAVQGAWEAATAKAEKVKEAAVGKDGEK